MAANDEKPLVRATWIQLAATQAIALLIYLIIGAYWAGNYSTRIQSLEASNTLLSTRVNDLEKLDTKIEVLISQVSDLKAEVKILNAFNDVHNQHDSQVSR